MRVRRLLWLLAALLPLALGEFGEDEPGDVTSLWPSAGEYLPDDPDAPSVTTSLDENGRRLAEESRRLQMILPPIKVVLTNVAHIVDTWKVYELEMLFGHCHNGKYIEPDLNQVYDSGSRLENAAEIGAQAFDKMTTTPFTAQCSTVTGGCYPYQAFVGYDITDQNEWALARKPNASFDLVRVKCVKLLQDDDPRYKANTVAIQEISLGGLEFVHRTVQVFENVAGGIWTRRPAFMNTGWRVRQLWETEAQWTVSELQFYEDVLCSVEKRGAPIVSSSSDPIKHGDKNLFDDNLTSTWVSNCTTPSLNASYEAFRCSVQEAYIGMDFADRQTQIRCLRMFQPAIDPTVSTARPTHTIGYALERWNGAVWYTMERLWDEAFVTMIPASLAPTMRHLPYVGGAPGVWEDMRPRNHSSWRVSNDDYTRGTWKVHELEFYPNTDCTGDFMPGRFRQIDNGGESVSMQGPIGENSSKQAFDHVPGPGSFWASGCNRMPLLNLSEVAEDAESIGGTGEFGHPCDRREAWVGLYWRNLRPDIGCIRVFQSNNMVHQSSSLTLDAWRGGRWEVVAGYRDVGGGSWNRRPSLPWSMWRVTNQIPLPGQWRMKEIRAYQDSLCLTAVSSGVAIGNGNFRIQEPVGSAFDSESVTLWGADCVSCNRSRKYWIGNELARDAPDPSLGINLVGCIKLWQSEIFEEQAQELRVDVWDGEDWQVSTLAPSGVVPGGGGGIWVRQPSQAFTKWRLKSVAEEERLWKLLEVELYIDPGCQTLLRMPAPEERMGTGGTSVLISGYRRDPQVSDDAIGLFSEAVRVTDSSINTGVTMEHKPALQMPAWFALDLLSERQWVRCIRLQQGSLPYEQVDTVHLEVWDGGNWTQNDPELQSEGVVLTGLGGGGWQRRPAAADTMWRLENLDNVTEGWAVYEVELHFDVGCSGFGGFQGLEGEAISSGFAPTRIRNGPQMAFDKDQTSAWTSQCSKVDESFYPEDIALPPVGCGPRQAWIGLDFGLRPWDVKCVKLWQVGYHMMQSSAVMVSRWDGTTWRDAWRMDGLGGSTWNQRPAGPNTMFRVMNKKKKQKGCPGQKSRIFNRAWGVSELKLFRDDACESEIRGGRTIASGSVEIFRRTTVDKPSYHLDGARDNDEDTVWAANCRFGWKSYKPERVDCSDAWLGLDFGETAVEVRCMKIMQSRLESSNCCDPAEEVELQRWNGSQWLEATWRHNPPVGASTTVPSRDLGAHFLRLGKCPLETGRVPYQDTKLWEQRARRNSDKCLVPLSGSVKLLSEKYCVEHPECVEFIGAGGTCCPIGDGSTSESRCCCSFLKFESVFEDEGLISVIRAEFSLERAIVSMSDYLPYTGFGWTILLVISALFLRPDAKKRWLSWAWDDDNIPCGCCCPRLRMRLRKWICLLFWPLLLWREFLAEGEGIIAVACCWFVLPGKKRTRPLLTQMHRLIMFMIVGTFVGGIGPWVGIGFLAGVLVLKVLVYMTIVVKWARSPYATTEREQDLRKWITGTHITKEDDVASAATVFNSALGVVIISLIYFMKFVFDVLVIRSTMISYNVIDSIDGDRIVELFTGFAKYLKEPAKLVSIFVYWAGQLMSILITQSIGIPKCEGSSVLVGAVGIVMVLWAVTQWLNFDLFGLFAAAKQASKKTRPECQRTFLQGAIMASIGIQFGAVQCGLVLFARAISVANPFTSNIWMCEYDDTWAIYLGRVFLLCAGVGGSVVVFLCANGHFAGQDYILKPVENFLKIDLSELDPDGGGPEGGMFRWDVALAAVPTGFGLWLDGWNVRGFLVEERSRVYAHQLRDPQPCVYCGKTHVEYSKIMRATGRQISLSMQILPYGTLLGKIAEYTNDPPLFYWGDTLTCMKSRTARHPLPNLGKNKFFLKSMLFAGDLLAWFIEMGVPILSRLFSLTLLALVMCGIFMVTEDNLFTTGSDIFAQALNVSILKAMCETNGFFSSLASWLLGVFTNMIVEASGKELDFMKLGVARTVAGQITCGITISTLLAAVLALNGTGDVSAAIMGGAGGYGFSLLSLLVNMRLERPAITGDEPPRPVTGPTVSKLMYSVAAGLTILLFAVQTLALREGVFLMLLVTTTVFLTIKMVLCERRGPIPDNPLITVGPSATRQVLFTVRGLPALLSIPSGGFVGGYLSGSVGADGLGRPFASLVFGILAAVIVGLTINRFLDHPPMLFGFFAGCFTFLCWQFWNAVVGLVFGLGVGLIVGSLLEERVVRQKRAQAQEDWDKEDDVSMRKSFAKSRTAGFSRMTSLGATTSLGTNSRRPSLAAIAPSSPQAEKKMPALSDSPSMKATKTRPSLANAPESKDSLREAGKGDAKPSRKVQLPEGTAGTPEGALDGTLKSNLSGTLKSVTMELLQQEKTERPRSVTVEDPAAKRSKGNAGMESSRSSASGASLERKQILEDAMSPKAAAASRGQVPASSSREKGAREAAAPSRSSRETALVAEGPPRGAIVDGFDLDSDRLGDQPAQELQRFSGSGAAGSASPSRGASRSSPSRSASRGRRGSAAGQLAIPQPALPPPPDVVQRPLDIPEVPDGELFGRWDRGGAAPNPASVQRPRRARAAPVKQSLWKAVAKPPGRPG